MTIVKSSAHRRLTSHLKFQPSLANVWLFVVAKNHVQLILWKHFWSIVLKSLNYHHQIVDLTLKLNKGPETWTEMKIYIQEKRGTKKNLEKAIPRMCLCKKFDQRAHVQCHSMTQQKTMMIAISKSHTTARSICACNLVFPFLVKRVSDWSITFHFG